MHAARCLQGVLAALGLALHLPSGAQLVADPLPGDPRLVVFNYEENNSFRIFTKPRAVTNIVLDQDERVRLFALGDTSSFQSMQRDNHIFIKPVFPNRVTWGTLLTTKRSYQVQLISTDDGGKWYQRVTFHHPDMVAIAEEAKDRAELAALVPQGEAASANQAPSATTTLPEVSVPPGAPDLGVDPATLNFDYVIEGKAPFRPLQVFDDGNRTTVRLPPDADTPAVFRIVGDEIELLEYTQHPRQPSIVIIPRVVEGLVLRLGREQVTVHNRKRSRAMGRRSFDLGE